MRTNAEPQEYERALHGVDFPASRDQIVAAARDKGGLDTEVMAMLGRLPARAYQDAGDLRHEVLRLYATKGPLGNGGPAAPSEMSNAGKDLISAAADSRVDDRDPLNRPEDDASRILERNRKLVDGEAEASAAGQDEVGVGHMTHSDRSHAGGAGNND